MTNSAFLDFFDHRGGVRTFGYPVSRECILYGSRVQFFQRAIMQLRPDGSVTTLNFLDAGLLPYGQINQSNIPQTDAKVVSAAPPPTSTTYGTTILSHIKATVPDNWQSLQVNFYQTFLGTVTAKDVFSGAKGNMALLPGFNLELWGVPTSAPMVDPNNNNFVYQRFQRGVMHYDKTTKKTQGLLLADYLKAIIVGDNLPTDLANEAKSSSLYLQYNPENANWVDRPDQLPNSDLTMAFEPDGVDGTNATSAAQRLRGKKIANEAMKYVGKPYLWGGESPAGFDCSGLTWYVMKQLGYTFPLHDLLRQAASGKQIDKSQLQAGDLVFFQNTYIKGISHVGIFIGNGQFINAAAEKIGVVVSNLNDSYWNSHYLSATRPFAK